MTGTALPLAAPPRRRPKPTFAVERDPRVTDPGRIRVSFLILLDGDLVMSPEHLGVAFMASVLREVGYTAEIREVEHGREAEATDRLVDFRPDLVCFTLMSLNVASCLRMAELVKQRLPGAVVACGGPAGTFAGTEVLRTNPHVDVVCTGEGEPVILDLAERVYLGEPLADCPGLCVRLPGGELRQNPPRPVIHDLDLLPFPVRDQLAQHGDKLEYVRVSTSRGCVAHCAFCSAPHLKNRVQPGKPWRARSPELVVDEVEQIARRHRFRTFDFVDSTFEDPDGGRVGKKRVAAIATGILERGLDIYYNVCMRAENWSDDDHDLLDLLVRSGLEKVNVGIESGVPAELELWEKKATVEDNARVIRLLREHGVYLAMGFIPFHPFATAETLLENAAFLRDNAGQNLRRMTERLEVYPGTRVIELMEQKGLLAGDYWSTLDPYGYHFEDPRVERLAKHFASLYNNDDYHRHGVITDQSPVFESETFNVVVQTFVSRLYRRFHRVPGAVEALEAFKDRLHAIRQQMGQFNYEFFLANLTDVLDDRLDPARQERQVLEINRYFRQQIDQIKGEQLRVGKALHRLGCNVAEISSSLPKVTPGGAPRSFATEGVSAVW
jgi:radical SAM superfamily enzyme YgiQ (UPF0313 family)